MKLSSRYLGGCNTSCQHKYLKENLWLVYSKVEDAIFYLPCVLFATKSWVTSYALDSMHGLEKLRGLLAITVHSTIN